jgi:hypothetical protein
MARLLGVHRRPEEGDMTPHRIALVNGYVLSMDPLSASSSEAQC